MKITHGTLCRPFVGRRDPGSNQGRPAATVGSRALNEARGLVRVRRCRGSRAASGSVSHAVALDGSSSGDSGIEAGVIW